MNKNDKKELQEAIELLDNAKTIIERIRDSEQEKFENLNEGLQQTERGQQFEENASTLDDIVSEVESAMDNLYNNF